MNMRRKIGVPILANIAGEMVVARKQKNREEQSPMSDALFNSKELEELEEQFATGKSGEVVERIYQRATARASGEMFRSVHPEVCGNRTNAQKIANFCEERGELPSFTALENAYKALMAEGELEVVDDTDAPRADARKESPRPTASDVAAGYPALSDREFMRLIDYDLSADRFKRLCLESPWFRERTERLFTSPMVDGINPRR